MADPLATVELGLGWTGQSGFALDCPPIQSLLRFAAVCQVWTDCPSFKQFEAEAIRRAVMIAENNSTGDVVPTSGPEQADGCIAVSFPFRRET